MTIRHTVIAASLIAVLGSLAGVNAEQTTIGTEVLTIGDYQSPMWTSGGFSGNHSRTFSQRPADCTQRLLFEIGDGTNEVVDGIDTAVRRTLPATRVDDLNSLFCVTFDYGVNAREFPAAAYGEFFVGPKIMVTPDTFFPPDNTGWHENYIIENSNLSPDTFDTVLTTSGTYLGATTHDGSEYKHYTVPKATWTQFWAIRQCYRNKGSMTVAPIFQYWRTQGLPNDYLIEVRLNVETFGAMFGKFVIQNYEILPSFSDACP